MAKRVIRYVDPVDERSDNPDRARERLFLFRQALLEHGADIIVEFREGPPPPDAIAAELDALLRL